MRQILICTPDKDLSQCVAGTRIVQLDRRSEILRDEAGVVAKFGIKPQSIPDFLAVVGDTADGFPGLPGWGVNAAALTLAQLVRVGTFNINNSISGLITSWLASVIPFHVRFPQAADSAV